ncbi:MAG: restriction endonuclease subunit S, partial [Candidatus Eremiobacteraeota bacterium]|nr:restriction endonuclease subunit S [Candidatus Eremiobacteraeota bacterium]
EVPKFIREFVPKLLTSSEAITELGLRKCNSKLYPKDTVFITARGTVGKIIMPSMDMAMNQSCYALRGKQGISQPYLFFATREQIDYLKKNTGGATFDTIVVDTFRRMLVVKPSNEVVVQFSQFIQPGMELILNILKKNTLLRCTRDLLLPKLISGEVDVSELDITVPEEAER